MNETFIRSRITELRLKKGVSEYKMSTDMGHSKSYIQSITSGRAMPSLSELLFMCEYFGVTPSEFFDEGLENPALLHDAINRLKTLNDDDLTLIIGNIKRLQAK